MERRGIDIGTVNAFIEKSKTPLPLSSDTSFLAGNTLEIKGTSCSHLHRQQAGD